MDVKDIRNLQEAYLEVYQLDEGKSSRPRYPGGRGVLDQERRDQKREASAEYMRGHTPGPGTITKNPKKLRKQKAMGELGEQNDIYDIILSHLINEGYAETPEAAEAIMVNMSDEWRESIVDEMLDEGLTGERYKKALKKGKQYSRMHSADPTKRPTRGGRGGTQHDFGSPDIGSGNRARRRAGKSVEDSRYVD